MTERRKHILARIGHKGPRVAAAFGVCGEARDKLVSQAKIMLNVHQDDTFVLEVVRMSYLLANRCVVLSEQSADPAEDKNFAEGVAVADYDDLPDCALALFKAQDERERLSRRGFEIISAQSAVDNLRSALEATERAACFAA